MLCNAYYGHHRGEPDEPNGVVGETLPASHFLMSTGCEPSEAHIRSSYRPNGLVGPCPFPAPSRPPLPLVHASLTVSSHSQHARTSESSYVGVYLEQGGMSGHRNSRHSPCPAVRNVRFPPQTKLLVVPLHALSHSAQGVAEPKLRSITPPQSASIRESSFSSLGSITWIAGPGSRRRLWPDKPSPGNRRV